MRLATCILMLSTGLCSWVMADEPQTPAAQPAAAQTPASSSDAVKPAPATAAAKAEIGSHFVRTRCNTIDELKNAELTGQEYTKQIQQQGSPTPFNPAGSSEH